MAGPEEIRRDDVSATNLSETVLQRTHERLRSAGLPDERISVVLDRAAQMLGCIEGIAELDADLPEPALVWRPIEEVGR